MSINYKKIFVSVLFYIVFILSFCLLLSIYIYIMKEKFPHFLQNNQTIKPLLKYIVNHDHFTILIKIFSITLALLSNFLLILLPLSLSTKYCLKLFLKLFKVDVRKISIIPQIDKTKYIPANYYYRLDAVGGFIDLQADLLIFHPHSCNFHKPTVSIKLSDIQEISIFKLCNLFPMGVRIYCSNKKKYTFAIIKRNEFIEKVNNLRFNSK